MRNQILFFCLVLFFSSCETNVNNNVIPGTTQAYVPVYADLSQQSSVSLEAAQPTTHAGKIYAYGNYIFQNDENKGIHIIDNSNPSQPHKIAFIRIPYSTEVAVKGSYLYTNSINDLIVLDLSNPQSPSVVKKMKNVFPLINQEYPPFTNVYFQCADASKGIVIDWQLQQVTNPTCRR